MNRIKIITLLAAMLTTATLFGDAATDQFNAAKKAFDTGQYESARTTFNDFLNRFPTHAKANEATFYLAESLMYLRQYPQAENYFNRLVVRGLTDPFAKVALFRIAEIPYIQGQLDVAKLRLEDFVEKLPHDSNLQFVLYYLGDIAMRSNSPTAALEAEHYFGQADRIFPDGDKSLESKLGLAWAKNKLGKIMEAEAIYSQLMRSTNPAVVEQATYQYGTALFERGEFLEAINNLTSFQRRYPTSSYLADSQRVIARCKGRLNDFEGALQTLSAIAQPTPEDLLMKVRFLYGLKRIQEAQSILAEAERTAGNAYRDEIALLKAVFLSDQKDWRSTITLLSAVLVPQFDEMNNRMTVNYLSLSAVPGTRKLSEEGFFRACSLLSLAYARNGEPAKAAALLVEMQSQSALSGNPALATICADTSTQLAAIGTVVPGRGGGGGGSFAGRNDQQWNPTAPTTPPRTVTPLAQGTDLEKFRRAETLYRAKNYEGTSQQLEQMLSGYYNQISTPPLYIIHYNINGATGTMNEQTFAKACSLLALSKAQLGDLEQANAVMMTLSSRIRMADPVQETLLRETYEQLGMIAKGGTAGSGALLSEADQRRLLKDANTSFRKQDYVQADAKLTELVSSNPAETMLTEALLLQGKAKERLGREQEGLAILERITDEFPSSKECAEALWYLGVYYESCGDSIQAVEYFQVLADKFQNFKHIDGALYYLAVDDMTNGNGRKAMTLLTRIHRNHRSGLYWSHAAWTLAYEAYKKKNYAQAESYVQEILRQLPDKVVLDRVLYLKGELALKRSDHDAAFLAFRAVGKLCPESPLYKNAVINATAAAGKMNVK
jgi:TolA-binding protein